MVVKSIFKTTKNFIRLIIELGIFEKTVGRFRVHFFGIREKKKRKDTKQAKKNPIRVNVAGSTVKTWDYDTELKIQTLAAMDSVDCISLSVACLRGIPSCGVITDSREKKKKAFGIKSCQYRLEKICNWDLINIWGVVKGHETADRLEDQQNSNIKTEVRVEILINFPRWVRV